MKWWKWDGMWWLCFVFFLSFSSDICDWKWNWELMIFEIWFSLFSFCWLFWNWVWIELFHISILFCCCFEKGGDDLNWIMLIVMREVEFCWLFFKLFIFISGKSIQVQELLFEGGRKNVYKLLILSNSFSLLSSEDCHWRFRGVCFIISIEGQFISHSVESRIY